LGACIHLKSIAIAHYRFFFVQNSIAFASFDHDFAANPRDTAK
jgi:hypothetical protein